MKAIGIIPARYASTRFPGKPLFEISGKSLIQRTYENAKQIQELDTLIIATDDSRIYEHARSFGAEVVMTSLNCATGTDRIQEVVSKEKRFANVDIVVNIQGDEPCLDPSIIQQLLKCLSDDTTAVVATPIAIIRDPNETENPAIVKCVKNQANDALYFSRALVPSGLTKKFQANTVYYKHVGIYAYRKEFLEIYCSLPSSPLQEAENLEQLKILDWGYKIKVTVVESTTLEVNYPEDIKKVEHHLCKQNSSS
ncbi:3-deoxy-manno-octulosonate cytidylyltransferase [Chlamydiales bacterium STE3]|nr:3-deoxy-manno-octulosonate cytidylyltransferase [Chlamydiales bacterium STE3]